MRALMHIENQLHIIGMLNCRSSKCSMISQRRDKIAKILNDQIKIAKRLSRDHPQFGMESRFAWEIVDELSHKLNKVMHDLEVCISEDREYYAKMDLSERLSIREYDC